LKRANRCTYSTYDYYLVCHIHSPLFPVQKSTLLHMLLADMYILTNVLMIFDNRNNRSFAEVIVKC